MYFSELVYTVRTSENNDKMHVCFLSFRRAVDFHPVFLVNFFRPLLPYEKTVTCFKKGMRSKPKEWF